MTVAQQPRVLVLGEVMRVLVAEPGDTVDRAERFRSTIGGAEGNVAAALARQDVPAAWVGRVGDDDAGRYVLRRMRAEGVDVADVTVDRSSFTGLLIRNTSAHGAISVTYHRAGSAGSRVSAADVARAWERQRPSLVHVTGISALLSDEALGAVVELLDRAAADDVPVSFDVNLRLRLAPAERWRDVVPPLVSRAQIVFAGDAELAVLAPDAGPQVSAQQWLAGSAEVVVVKNGDHTCTAFTADGEVTQPTLVRSVVDPVGAGDALVAGFLAAHLTGADAAGCLARGAAAAAFAVQHWSDTEGLPTGSELDAFVAAIGRTGEQVLR